MDFIINFYDKKVNIQIPNNFQNLKIKIEDLFKLKSSDCENNLLYKFIDKDGDFIEIVNDYDFEQFLKLNQNEIFIELHNECLNMIRNSCNFNKEGEVEIEENKLRNNLEKINNYNNERNKEGIFYRWFNFIKTLPLKIFN